MWRASLRRPGRQAEIACRATRSRSSIVTTMVQSRRRTFEFAAFVELFKGLQPLFRTARRVVELLARPEPPAGSFHRVDHERGSEVRVVDGDMDATVDREFHA